MARRAGHVDDPGGAHPNTFFARFVITPAGPTFLIQPYEVGPYTSGPFRVKIPFAAFGSALNPAGLLKGLRR